MKVKCEKCGETYILEDGEKAEDYTCECGGELREEDLIKRVAVGAGLVSPFYLIIGFLDVALLGFLMTAALWRNRDKTFHELSVGVKVVTVIAVLYVIGTLLLLLDVSPTLGFSLLIALYIISQLV